MSCIDLATGVEFWMRLKTFASNIFWFHMSAVCNFVLGSLSKRKQVSCHLVAMRVLGVGRGVKWGV